MKISLAETGFYTGPRIEGFFYGVADRDVNPEAGVDTFLAAQGFPRPYRAKQVHGDRIVTGPQAAAEAECEADAILIGPGESAVIRVADCVPILLLDPERRAAAAVHAGWRGTFENIAVKASLQLGPPATLFAYIGPAIGGCCYEISDELAARFQERFGAGPWLQRVAGKPHLDLQLLNAHLLREAGIGRVEIEARCTRDAADLHSFRRDGAAAGRLAAFVALPR
jgi:YfiH family protein